ncbi:MAG: hypothetical protein O7G83_13095 [Proteobacteria bacterium]|nr:hypothetical protein [Pseudomonadota bacterium]
MAPRQSRFDDLIMLRSPLGQFFVIGTHLSCHFHRAIDYLGLRRNRSSSQIINQAQDLLEQTSWDGNLGQLERDVSYPSKVLRGGSPPRAPRLQFLANV